MPSERRKIGPYFVANSAQFILKTNVFLMTNNGTNTFETTFFVRAVLVLNYVK